MDDCYGNEVNMDYDLDKLINAVIEDAMSVMFESTKAGIEYWIEGFSHSNQYNRNFQSSPVMFYKYGDMWCAFKEGPNEAEMKMVNKEGEDIMWDSIFDPTIDKVTIKEEDIPKILEALETSLDIIKL